MAGFSALFDLNTEFSSKLLVKRRGILCSDRARAEALTAVLWIIAGDP
jgi:hypothetical protein